MRNDENSNKVVPESGGPPTAHAVPAIEMASAECSYGMFAGQFTMSDDFEADSHELADLFGVARGASRV